MSYSMQEENAELIKSMKESIELEKQIVKDAELALEREDTCYPGDCIRFAGQLIKEVRMSVGMRERKLELMGILKPIE